MTQVLRAFRKALILGPVVLLATAIVVAALALWRSRRGAPSRDAWVTSLFDGLTILAIAGPLAITLVPSGGSGGRSLDLIPLRAAWRRLTNSVDAEAAAVQLGGNVLLFVPFGFVAPIRWPALADLRRILLATLAFGVLLEGLQFAAGFGRVATASDVLLYAIGGLVGYAAFRAIRGRCKPWGEVSGGRGRQAMF
jgi:glycopeptide antibiotics resistance protein